MLELQDSRKTITGLLKRRRAWIFATLAVFVAVTAIAAVLVPPSYQATALVVIDQRATSPTADLNAQLTTGQLVAAHYIKMANTSTVLERVCRRQDTSCTYDSLKSQLSLSTVKGTDLLAVSVSDPSPARAANLADLVAAALLAENRAEIAQALKPTKAYLDAELSRTTKALGSAKPEYFTTLQAQETAAYNNRVAVGQQETRLDGSLYLAESAVPPNKPAFSLTKTYVGAGIVVGLVVALIIALIVDRLDTRIFGKEALSAATRAPVVVTC